MSERVIRRAADPEAGTCRTAPSWLARPPLVVLVLLPALWPTTEHRAATPLQTVRVSPDVTASLGASVVGHGDVAADNLAGSVTLLSLGAIPRQADIDGYHRLANGHHLISFDTTVSLPGGITARPADVVRFDGASYSIEFDSILNGIPPEANVDAVSIYNGFLLLSFDLPADLGGLRVDDEDLVLFDGTRFNLFFDGSAAGISPDLDLDAAHYIDCNDHLLVSFDGSGAVGALSFDDEDVLEYDRVGTWEIAYDGSSLHAAWREADLDALHATVDPGPGPPLVFGQTIRAAPNRFNLTWPNPVPFRAVRGAFTTPAGVGTYAFDWTFSGNGTLVSDLTMPSAGTGLWYLVKLGGCRLTSWQTTLGAEPGRDAALP